MNDQERLEDFIDRIQKRSGLEPVRYQRLVSELESVQAEPGFDEQGRFKLAMFDAKGYDMDSFERHNAGRLSIHPIPARLDRETVAAAADFQAICIFVNDQCDAEVVSILASLGVKLIALRCAGFNNVDLESCRNHDISVVRVPAYSPHAVAEHTVALMLMLNRHLHQAYMRNRTGSFVLDGLTGFDMRGKTVGVVGTGKIGQCVVDILLGFGCRILAFDKYPNEELVGRNNVDYVDLDAIWTESDIITLHVPLFEETHHLISAGSIAHMKNGVMLINTSRGGLVDTRALIEGLKSGKIGSAGLDVYEEEAGIFFNDLSHKVLTDDVLARLMTFNNVVVTSHQAFLTREALANIAETTLMNITEFLEGKRGGELTNGLTK